MYFVYILQSLKDNRTYVGYTNDFERRFKEHNLGRSKATRYRVPFKLLFKEEFTDMAEAKKRELWWKNSTGRKKLKEYFESKSFPKF
jgi:putative endonuclease